MGKVEGAIREAIHPGMQLATPGQARPFEIAEINTDGIVLLLGQDQWRTPIPGMPSKDSPTYSVDEAG